MRENASKILIFAGLVLSASFADARPVKAAPHKAAAAHNAVTAASHRREGVPKQARAAFSVHEQPSRRSRAEARERAVSDIPERPHTRKRMELAHGQKADDDRAMAPSVEQAPEVHVRHNRKPHPADAASQADSAQRASVDALLPTSVDEDQPTEQKPVPDEIVKHAVKLTVSNAAPSVTVKKSKIVVKSPVEELDAAPVFQPVLYTRSGRLIVPPAMKGSHEILLHQNAMADRDGLERVRDDEALEQMRGSKMLVAIPLVAGLEVDERLPLNRRYCRPWTAQFLAAMARAHYARFHTPLQVNSAVRTVEFQERLRYTNGNAAPAEGETASPHLTGQAVDLAKHGLSMTEIAWLRGYLLPLVQEGRVDVEEEFQQACFHVSVYRSYMPQAAPDRVIQGHRSAATALAAAIR